MFNRATSTVGQTRYPVVLVHGLLNFDKLFGLNYFYGIPSAMTKDGTRVFVAQVSAANSIEVRGEQLLAQVKNILAVTGAGKGSLIGHSQDGSTTRYVAGVAPALVTFVTSAGGVNQGSRVACCPTTTLPVACSTLSAERLRR